MKKNTSEEALYERMRQLAEVNKKTVNESSNRTLGTLIDYKRASDGVAYGIIKENHHYYIKKAGLKQDPDVADFAYIGGLQNIKEYQYETLAKADKQRNMIFQSINEAFTNKISKTGSKQKLNEDKVTDELAQAEQKLGDAEIATNEPEVPAEPSVDVTVDEPTPEVPAETGDETPAPSVDVTVDEPTPEVPTETGDETPAPEGDETPAPEGDETPAPEGDETPAPEGDEENKDITTKEIEKTLGKLTNKIRKTEMTDSQVKSYVNTFLSAFKDKFPDVEIEDRKAMAEKITKVVPDEEIEDLEQNVEQTSDDNSVEENNSFAQYAESRGYSPESMKECDEEELGNLVSGYANAYGDGENNGDHKTVALFIKLMPQVLDILKNEYGHEEYADELEPEVKSLEDTDNEEISNQINEIWGGLGSLAKGAAQGIKQGAQAGLNKIGQAAQGIKQQYYKGEVNPAIKKVEIDAANLGKQIANLNNVLTKSGQQPLNIGSILTTIKNQLGSGGVADLSKYRTNEEIVDITNTEVQPVEENNINFAPEGQNLGGGVIKPESATMESVEINEMVSKLKETLKEISENLLEGKEKPSAGLSKEKKSEVVKAAKAGKDIGKKGKGFEKVADKAAKEYGSKEKGKKVAAAAMWKNIKKEGVEDEEVMSESEVKLRKYIRTRLEEKTGIRKAILNEDKKSESLKKLDKLIDYQYQLYESAFYSGEIDELNIMGSLGLGPKVTEKEFQELNPNDVNGVETLFNKAYNEILINPTMGRIKRIAKITPIEEKYELLKLYVINRGGTLRIDKNDKLAYQSANLQSKSTTFAGGGRSRLGA